MSATDVDFGDAKGKSCSGWTANCGSFRRTDLMTKRILRWLLIGALPVLALTVFFRPRERLLLERARRVAADMPANAHLFWMSDHDLLLIYRTTSGQIDAVRIATATGERTPL